MVVGAYGSGGSRNNGSAATLHGGTIPAMVWNIVLVTPNGNIDSSRVGGNARLIAISIQNANSATGGRKNYPTPVDAIETATGYDTLNRLPVALQGVPEASQDNL